MGFLKEFQYNKNLWRTLPIQRQPTAEERAQDINSGRKRLYFQDHLRPIIPSDAGWNIAFKDLVDNPNTYRMGCVDCGELIQFGAGGDAVAYLNVPSSKDLVPGDGLFISNTGPGPKNGATIGQNIIYLGDDEFYGLAGRERIRTLKEWQNHVFKWNNGARLLPRRVGPLGGLIGIGDDPNAIARGAKQQYSLLYRNPR